MLHDSALYKSIIDNAIDIVTLKSELRVTPVHWQELSYRKQIARQLRTQYMDGIYNNTVTLKYGLEVTQGHWKWYLKA